MSGSAALDQAFAALADPHCRRVVELLRVGPRRAGELAAEAGLRPPAMSRRLRTLRESRLVEETHGGPDARVRVYRLRAEGMDELRKWLAETEQLWSDQLAAFKEHLERDPE